jgi:hypothetical protein
MKRFILKYKIILAASIVMLGLSWNVEASFEPGEKWNSTRDSKFKDPFASSGEGSLRGGGITPGDPGDTAQGEEEDDLPIGNAIPFVAALALIYGISLSKNKTRLIIQNK